MSTRPGDFMEFPAGRRQDVSDDLLKRQSPIRRPIRAGAWIRDSMAWASTCPAWALSQYALLHFGQIMGRSLPRGTHTCPHRAHSCCVTVIFRVGILAQYHLVG